MNKIVLLLFFAFPLPTLGQSVFPTDGSNVGIGTTNPTYRLSLEASDTTIINMAKFENKAITKSLMFIGNAPATYAVLLHRKANVLESYTDLHISAANAGQLFFETGRTGTVAPIRMTLDNIGRLGIGTTTPTTLLKVNGGAIRLNNPGLYPYGINIDVNFPEGWSREYSISYGGTGKLFAWGVQGYGNAMTYAYIGGNTTADVAGTAPWMAFKPNGNVGIGTTNPQAKLAVNGDVFAKKVKVTQASADWPDYVFEALYILMPLDSLEGYVKENKHLPEIPTAAMVEKEGLDLGEINKTLTKKLEEVILYLIELNKRNKMLEERLQQLETH